MRNRQKVIEEKKAKKEAELERKRRYKENFLHVYCGFFISVLHWQDLPCSENSKYAVYSQCY